MPLPPAPSSLRRSPLCRRLPSGRGRSRSPANSPYSIGEIRTLLSLMHGGKPCTAARNLAEGHLVALRRKLADLRALETAIASLVSECDASCLGGPASDCVILQTV